MSDGKVWTKETTQLIVDYLFSLFSGKIPWYLRAIAKIVMKTIIQFANKFGDKHIPDRVDPLINSAIVAIHNKQWNTAGQAIGLAGDELVKIKRISGQHKKNAFVAVAMALTDMLKDTIDQEK